MATYFWIVIVSNIMWILPLALLISFFLCAAAWDSLVALLNLLKEYFK